MRVNPKSTLQLVLTTLLMQSCLLLNGQGSCGTPSSIPPADYHHLYKSFNGLERNAIIDSVGIAVHIIDPGTTPVPTMDAIDEAVEIANGYFEGAGLHFFICDVNIIPGNRQNSVEDIQELNKRHYVDHRINFYLTSKLIGTTFQLLCGTSTFPWAAEAEDRYNAISFDCFGDGHTMAHELGHYYGLLHTHDVSYGIELVSGSNCDSAGDMLCDTPADPGLGFHNVAQCQYSGSDLDPEGAVYTPDPSLLMSYTPSMCATRFSDHQLRVMGIYAEEVHHDLVRRCEGLVDFGLSTSLKKMTTNFIASQPIPLVINGSNNTGGLIDITYWISETPGDRGTLISKRTVNLDQQVLPLNYDLSFVIPPGRNDGLHYLTIKLDADRNYMEQNEWNNEVVIEMTLVNSSLADVVLFPNPVTDILNVFRRSAVIPGSVDIRINDLAGRSLREYQFDGDFEQFYIQLDVETLEPGLYQLSMTSANRGAGFDHSFLFVKR